MIMPNSHAAPRKFAYSLTDKYKGSGLGDEICWKQPNVYAGSHVSSSDGGASYMIPSETDRVENSQINDGNKNSVCNSNGGNINSSRRKDKSKVDSTSKSKISKRAMAAGGSTSSAAITSSHGNLASGAN